MADADLTVEILREIRDEIRGVRTGFGDEIRGLRTELGEEVRAMRGEQMETNRRLDIVETTLLDLAQQQRFVVRYTKAISERDEAIVARVSDLEQRVGKLETR